MDERQTKVSIIEISIGVGGLGERNGQASPTERLIDVHLELELGVWRKEMTESDETRGRRYGEGIKTSFIIVIVF